MSDTLLIMEDEELLGGELGRHFERDGWDVVWVRSLAEAREVLLEQAVDPLVVLADMNLPDGNALDLLEDVKGQLLESEWILLTGYGSVPDSVRALRLGAFDFLQKPCPPERLDLVITGAARGARAQRRLAHHADQEHHRYRPETFLGASKQAKEVRALIRKLAQAPLSAVLLGGETGTGKGLVARILHHQGARKQAPLIEVNCSALPAELLESELFGHEAGAFTGAKGRHRGLMEQANGGTLFLDEVTELSAGLQAKLLKALEDRTVRRVGGEREIRVDVQILAASNQPLKERVAAGRFREDLYHRLSVFRLDLPPLRERMADLDELLPQFLAEYNAIAGKRVRVVTDDVWARLRAHSWPGNVRELRNVIERGVLLSSHEVFPREYLQLEAEAAPPEPGGTQPDGVFLPLDGSVSFDEMERQILGEALVRTRHNITAAARLLGLSRQTLRYRLKKYDLH